MALTEQTAAPLTRSSAGHHNVVRVGVIIRDPTLQFAALGLGQ